MLTLALETYREIAKNTSVFNDKELLVLEELLEKCDTTLNSDYILFDESVDGRIIGFVIFGKTPMTIFSWDIYWLVVDKQVQGKGVGKKLLKRVEEFLMREQGRLVLRIETSGTKRYAVARCLYQSAGFSEGGRIPDFYAAGDDLVIFYKEAGRGVGFYSAEPR